MWKAVGDRGYEKPIQIWPTLTDVASVIVMKCFPKSLALSTERETSDVNVTDYYGIIPVSNFITSLTHRFDFVDSDRLNKMQSDFPLTDLTSKPQIAV